MAAEFEIKGKKLVITIDADLEASEPSASGKTRIVASTSGNVNTGLKVKGKDLIVGLNAYVKNS